nr:MAG TPA: minor tail protein [Caudoviricetes sp.]
MSDYVISAILRVKDELSGKTKKAKDSLSGVKSAAEGASAGLDHTESAMKKAAMSAVALAAKADKAKTELSGLRGTYAPTLSIKDKATEKITGIKGMLGSLSGKAYTATVNVRQNLSGAAGVASGLAGKAGGALSGMAGGMMMNTSMQMAGAAGIGMGIYDTVKTYMDFEAQMKKVQAISGASGEDFEALTAKAKEMGAATQFSATESAQALEYMAMAGWKTDDMLGGISGIMDLAAASGEDLGRVSDIVTDALTAFGLQASDSAHFADVLAQASSNSNTNVSMMGMTFQYVAPLAGALKYSIEDVGIAMGLMANNSIKGEKAGTALRAILTRLVDPPKEAGSAMDRLGITVKNADGTMKPLRQTMKELRSAFAGLSAAEQAEAASAIAGQEAISGMLSIVNASETDFDKLTAAIDNAEGAAGNMAKTVNDNLKGDLKSLSSVWESVQLEFMSGKGADGLREFVKGVKDDVAKFKGYIEDGFDISDIGRSAMDVLVQLKNKFIELDGVGSLLAGGALAGGLYKIVSLSKKAVDGIKGLGGAGKPVPGGASTGVGEMVVNAGTVIVNGKGVTGAAGVGGAVESSGGVGKGTAKGRFGGASKVFKGLGALALLDAGLSIYDAYTTNAQTTAEAQYGVDSAQTNEEKAAALEYQKQTEAYNADRMGTAVGSGAGALAGGLLGAKAGAAGGAAIGALFGGVGAAPGALIGSLLGGVAGAFGGSELGGMIGSGIAENFDGALAYIKEGWTDLSDWFGATVWTPIYDGAVEQVNLAVGVVALGADAIKPYWEPVASWFDGTVWQPITNNATWAWNGITSMASGAVTGVCSFFEPLASWFDVAVWQPLSSMADGTKTSVVSAFDAALSGVKSIWSGVADWFDANVISPLREKFSSLIDLKNSIADAGSSVTGLTTSNGTGHNAIGTSFWEGGWTEVNENGGEIIDLPQGSRVYPHATTMKMLRDSMGGSGSSPIPAAAPVTITGNTFHVREEADLDRIAYKLYQLMAKSHVNMNAGVMA